MMSPSLKRASVRGLVFVFAISSFAAFAPQAHAAFHLWAIREIYTNSSGNLQFVEMFDPSGGQQFTTNQQIAVQNVGGTQTHTFKLLTNTPDPTLNHALLFGTAGLTAAGGPTPDFIIPDGFLFSGGGTISFFGANGGSYAALPTDGILSRAFPSSTNQTNSPQNYAGAVGSVPEPEAAVLIVSATACLIFAALRRHAHALS